MNPILRAGAPANFTDTYPVALALDNGGLPVLYLNVTAPQTLQFRIGNVSSSRLVIPKQAQPASASACQLMLVLQPGVLDPARLGTLSLAESGWSFAAQTGADGGTELYLARLDDLPFAAGVEFTLTLGGIELAATIGLSLTQVGLAFQLVDADTLAPVSGSRSAFLQLAPGTGNASNPPPIWFGCDGANTLVNDGHTANGLSLLVANRAAAAPLVLNPASSAAPTRFTLSFDVQGNGESRPWALATVSQVQGIGVQAGNADWNVEYDGQSALPRWSFTSGSAALAAGAALPIGLSGIVTGLPNGATTAYLDYRNLPGYADGQFTVALEKGPLSIAGAALGVGAPARAGGAALQVTGAVQATSFTLTGGAALLPAGTIVMWAGDTVPTGWRLCDGSNGTPDLSSRFIVGAGPNPPAGQPGYRVRDSGGADAHTHTGTTTPQDNVGSTDMQGRHRHQIDHPICFFDGESDTTPGSYGKWVPNVWNASHPLQVEDAGVHQHQLNVPALSLATGAATGPDYHGRPAWFALMFIMKE